MTNKNSSINGSQVHSLSWVGKVRDHNEDAVLIKQWPVEQLGPLGIHTVVAVADGMGGHERGEWASQTALRAFMDTITHANVSRSIEDAVKEALDTTNMVIFSGAPDSGSSHPGTTFTVAVIRGHKCTIGHVGDSRLYLLRDGRIKQVTEDHSWAGELMRQGKMTPEEAANWVHKNQITRAIGIRATVEPSVYSLELLKGDVLLLCSDGLSGMINDEQILNILNSSSSAKSAGDQLCTAANAAGGEDNISVVLYSHEQWPAPRKSLAFNGNSRRKTLPGNDAVSNKLPAHHSRLSNWIILLLAIGMAVVLGAGIYLVLKQPKPVPVVQPGRQQQKKVTENIVRQPSATLQIEWDKENRKIKIMSSDAAVKGVTMNDISGWISKDVYYNLSKKDEKALEDGAVLIIEGVKTENISFYSSNILSMPVETDGEYTLKLAIPDKPEKIIGKIEVKIESVVKEN